MIGKKSKYGSVQNAMTTWKDYMVSMGFGYKLGIDLPGEKRMFLIARIRIDHTRSKNLYL